MTYCTVTIDKRGSDRYARLYHVLRSSIREHDPEAGISHIRETVPAAIDHLKPNAPFFMRKLICYRDMIRRVVGSGQTAEDAIVGLLDADMMMVSPLPRIDFGEFDLLFTKRSAGMGVVNTGVIFARANRTTIDFFDRWIAALDSLYQPEQFETYCDIAQIHAGGDQAALAYLRQDPTRYPARIGELPCSVFNLTQSEWEEYEPGKSVFVHIKSDLRKLCFGEHERMRAPATAKMRELAAMWRSYEGGR